MRLPEERVEGLVELAQRGGLRPHPPLLEDHVALAVELAEDRVDEPVGLQPGPQLEPVGGEADEVRGEVLGGEGVQLLAAVSGVDLVHLVLHDHVALLGHQVVELRFQLAVARGLVLRLQQVVDLAPPQALAHDLQLGAHQLPDLLLLLDDLQVGRDVLGADGVRALEHHVLEQVADPGDALRSFCPPWATARRGGGRVCRGKRAATHPVGEGHLGDLDARLGGRSGGDQDEGEDGAEQAHAVVPL
jgi:hypothetical protein